MTTDASGWDRSAASHGFPATAPQDEVTSARRSPVVTLHFEHPADPTLCVGPADVERAARRLQGRVHHTPVLTSRLLDELAGRRLFLKAEHLQHTGSYKARGAVNHVRSLDQAKRPRGLIAASSGNHGQAVAWAARQAGLPATIVVPSSIAPPKRCAIDNYGARVVVVGESSEERLAVAQEIARRERLHNIPPYDHPLTIAGQGTWLAEALEDVDCHLEAVVVPMSGGGLVSGTLLAASAHPSTPPVFGVEPEGAADIRASLQAGERVEVSDPFTVADALRARRPGYLTFEVIRSLITEAVVVSDEEIVRAMVLLAERTKQVAEPGGAAALAAALEHRIPGKGPLLVLISGGNVSWNVLAEVVMRGA